MTGRNKLVRPFIKWAGGKRQLIPELKKFTSKQKKTYYEPFIGGGALLFELQPKSAVISDLNEELIMTYKSVKNEIDELVELLKVYATRNNSDDYYAIRSLDREPSYNSLSDLDKAARLIYLNKTCYNGLYRVNSQGLFNTPFGNYKNPAICDELILRAVSDYLNEADVIIRNVDFEESVSDAAKGDYVYFDPPYHSPDNSNFTGYQSGGFDESEQRRLRDAFSDLTDKGVFCMLSNSSTGFIHELYKDKRFDIRIVKAIRPINSKGSDRGAVDEVLITNWRD